MSHFNRRSRSRERASYGPPGGGGGGDYQRSRSPARYGQKYGPAPGDDGDRRFRPEQDRRPSYGGERPGYGGERPGYGGDRPAYGGDRPAYGGDRPSYGGDRDFKSFGGRGGGGRGGGGRDGGGRGGKKLQMIEMQSVVDVLRKNESSLGDSACLRVMDPSIEDRYRDDLIATASDADKKFFLPNMDAWRVSDSVGVPVNNVRANFFAVDPRYLPTTVFLYNIAIFDKRDFVPADDSMSVSSSSRTDLSKEKDSRLNTKIMKMFISNFERMKTTTSGEKIGVSYDGKSSMYTSRDLELPFDTKGVFLADVTLPRGGYVVGLSRVDTIAVPKSKEQWRDLTVKNRSVLQGLDVALLSFARWQLADDDPSWLFSGTKVFKTNAQSFDLGGIYVGRVGYSSCLRPCWGGLSMVIEVSVSCFLKGGSLLDIMALVGSYRSVDDMIRSGCCSSPTHPFLRKVMDVLRGTKIKTKHLGQTKKLKSFSFPSDAPETRFVVDGVNGEPGREMSVAEYYEIRARSDKRYAEHMPSQRLRYPSAVTVDIGSKKKSILVPVELLVVMDDQIRNNLPSDVSANLIKEAAIPPARRFKILTEDSERNGLFQELKRDPNACAFGLQNVSTAPTLVHAVVLPPPKLQYANRTVLPELKGSWNLAGNVQFAFPPKVDTRDRRIPYGLMTTYLRGAPQRIDDAVHRFRDNLEREATNLGAPMQLIGNRAELVCGEDEDLARVMWYFKEQGARIVVVLLHSDVYGFVKLAADRLALPTQCVKWTNVERPPNRYHTSLMIKMNYKMGGVNHTLASRAPFSRRDEEPVFQDPPKSISWLFDEPCMVMGVDVNHPEIGQTGNSVAAVVASMDGKLGQYAAYVTSCPSRDEPVQNLQEAASALLDAFSRRNNGATPRKIIVYRDGVSDSQFEVVLQREITAYKEALMLRGFGPDDVQIAVIMCQKRHQTRFVYKADERVDGTNEYINPCVGLCVDGRNQIENPNDLERGCINTPGLNEFYLTSHAAILGTAKPCKYVLIYDEIGLKLSEIELFTFWNTHLYARCTRSVSYATPAYYAHWAARRGKALLNAGASMKDLEKLSEGWLREGLPSMYFV